MRQLSVSIVVAATWAGCGDAPPAHDVTLPSRLAATPAPAPQPVLTITLTKDGRVVVDGKLTFAIAEERLNRRAASRYPASSVGCASIEPPAGDTSSGC